MTNARTKDTYLPRHAATSIDVPTLSEHPVQALMDNSAARSGRSTNPDDGTGATLIHIIRHGQALHNVEHGYPHRDPPLTEAGQSATRGIKIPTVPDIILVSPMTRAIETAMNAFPSLLAVTPLQVEVQIWPELREVWDSNCNKGRPRAELSLKYPQFDFSECHEEWDHPSYTVENATARAETVRRRLQGLSGAYKDIAIVTHRGFIAFLVKGRRFDVCETRSYRFATDGEMKDESARHGIHCETLQDHDFGPTVLVLHKAPDTMNCVATS